MTPAPSLHGSETIPRSINPRCKHGINPYRRSPTRLFKLKQPGHHLFRKRLGRLPCTIQNHLRVIRRLVFRANPGEIGQFPCARLLVQPLHVAGLGHGERRVHVHLEELARLDREIAAARTAIVEYTYELNSAGGIKPSSPAGRYLTDPSKTSAEMAFSVRDDWQRRGLGTLLFQKLVEMHVVNTSQIFWHSNQMRRLPKY